MPALAMVSVTSGPHVCQFSDAKNYDKVAGPISSSKTYPRNVTILYLVSSSHNTFTPVSVIWLTLSLKHTSEDNFQSEQRNFRGSAQLKNPAV